MKYTSEKYLEFAQAEARDNIYKSALLIAYRVADSGFLDDVIRKWETLSTAGQLAVAIRQALTEDKP